MSITKCPGHMRSLKLNFSATVLTLDLKAKNFRKFKTVKRNFEENCARAPRLTAVWPAGGKAKRNMSLRYTCVKKPLKMAGYRAKNEINLQIVTKL